MGLFNWLSRIGDKNDELSYMPVFINDGIGSKDPIRVDVSLGGIRNTYESNPYLNAIISKLGEMASNVKIQHYDKNGNVIENSVLVKMLNNPNLLQNFNEYIKNLIIVQNLYGNSFEYMPKSRLSDYPFSATIIDPAYMTVNKTGRYLDVKTIEDIIKSYSFEDGDFSRDFFASDMLHTAVNSMNGIVGTSRVLSLELPLSNIKAVLESSNTIYSNYGAIGFISKKNEPNGAISLSPTSKKAIEDTYRKKYGLTKGKQPVGIVDQEISFVPISIPIKDLLLTEEVEKDFRIICDVFGLNINCFSSIQSATFDNKKDADKIAYQNTVIPQVQSVLNKYANRFKLNEKGESLYADFSHLPLLAEDEKIKAETVKVTCETLKQLKELLDSGGISEDEYTNLKSKLI